jgi:amylosucrase
LLYSSDEIAKLNDYSYRDHDDKKHDDRWVNRIAVTEHDTALALAPCKAPTLQEKASKAVFDGLQTMLSIRKEKAIFGDATTTILETDNQHCFAFLRENNHGGKLLVLCNFSDHEQKIESRMLEAINYQSSIDLLTQHSLSGNETTLVLKPLQQMWLYPNK